MPAWLSGGQPSKPSKLCRKQSVTLSFLAAHTANARSRNSNEKSGQESRPRPSQSQRTTSRQSKQRTVGSLWHSSFFSPPPPPLHPLSHQLHLCAELFQSKRCGLFCVQATTGSNLFAVGTMTASLFVYRDERKRRE